MNGIIRRIRLACVKYGFSLWVRHIPGVENVESDALSRGVLSRRVAGWSMEEGSMAKWVRARGPFTHDVYADVNGRNSQAPAWFSSQSRPGRLGGAARVWAFPPPSLAELFWEEQTGWEAGSVTAVLPDWACVRMPEGWSVLWTYQAGGRMLKRRVGERWVRCSCAGVKMMVVAKD